MGRIGFRPRLTMRIRKPNYQRDGSSRGDPSVGSDHRARRLFGGTEADESPRGGGAGRVQEAALDDGTEDFEKGAELHLGPHRGEALDVDVVRHGAYPGRRGGGRGVRVGKLDPKPGSVFPRVVCACHLVAVSVLKF